MPGTVGPGATVSAGCGWPRCFCVCRVRLAQVRPCTRKVSATLCVRQAISRCDAREPAALRTDASSEVSCGEPAARPKPHAPSGAHALCAAPVLQLPPLLLGWPIKTVTGASSSRPLRGTGLRPRLAGAAAAHAHRQHKARAHVCVCTCVFISVCARGRACQCSCKTHTVRVCAHLC